MLKMNNNISNSDNNDNNGDIFIVMIEQLQLQMVVCKIDNWYSWYCKEKAI